MVASLRAYNSTKYRQSLRRHSSSNSYRRRLPPPNYVDQNLSKRVPQEDYDDTDADPDDNDILGSIGVGIGIHRAGIAYDDDDGGLHRSVTFVTVTRTGLPPLNTVYPDDDSGTGTPTFRTLTATVYVTSIATRQPSSVTYPNLIPNSSSEQYPNGTARPAAISMSSTHNKLAVPLFAVAATIAGCIFVIAALIVAFFVRRRCSRQRLWQKIEPDRQGRKNTVFVPDGNLNDSAQTPRPTSKMLNQLPSIRFMSPKIRSLTTISEVSSMQENSAVSPTSPFHKEKGLGSPAIIHGTSHPPSSSNIAPA